MSDDQLIVKPGAATSFSGKNQKTALQYQMGISPADFKVFRTVIQRNAVRHLDLRHGYYELVKDSKMMNTFMQACTTDWPSMKKYHRGWPAKSCLRLLIRFKSQLLQAQAPGRSKSHNQKPCEKSMHTTVTTSARAVTPRLSVSASEFVPELENGTRPRDEFHTFEAFLHTIHPSLPKAKTALLSFGVYKPVLVKALARLSTRDQWLETQMNERKITLVEHQVLRTALSKYFPTLGSSQPRFIISFKEAGADSIRSFLESLWPPLSHLEGAMSKLGFVDADDLRDIVYSVDLDRVFWNAAVSTGLMSPIEAKLILEGFAALAAINY